MKTFLNWIGAGVAVTCIGMTGHAQDEEITDESSDMTTESDMTTQSGMSDATAEAIRAPSPRLSDPSRTGFFQIGAGPSFGIGLDSDTVMYNILASYNRNFTEHWSGKVIADLYLGGGNDAARMINVGVGADYYLTHLGLTRALPYVTGDVSWGFARNGETEETENAPVIGVGTGMKFIAADLNWDVNAHYSILTAELENTVPSVFGIRAAVNF
jgi:hypothetical protein